jgi:HK97 family phage major capsid protein
MSTIQRINQMRRDRAALVVEMRSMTDDIAKENRDMTVEEREQFDGKLERAENMAADIRRLESLVNDADYESVAKKSQGKTAKLGMSDSEVRSYSLIRAIDAASRNDWSRAGLELEASRAVSKQLGRDARSFFVPADFLHGRRQTRQVKTRHGWQFRAMEQRADMTVGTAGDGGNLVATDMLADSFIDALRNRMVVLRAGAMSLSGLNGDVAIPKQTGGATAYWVAEDGAPTNSNATVGQVALTPHTVGAYTDISRKLLKQSSVDVEQLVRNDLTQVLSIAIDYAALHGDSGTDANQPDGIETFGDTTSVAGGTNGAAPTWGNIVGLETAVAQDNADVGRLAYVTNAKVRGKLKQTVIGTDQRMIWGGDNLVNGYDVFTTNQVRSNRSKGSGTNLSTIFYGNWGDLLIGFWSGLDIMVDPYSNSTTGAVRVVAFQDVDINSRHDESFAAMLDAITT